MVIVEYPDNLIAERMYAINVIFDEFLGIEYRNTPDSRLKDKYIIRLENGNTLIIQDHFFRFFSENNTYLDRKNIPKKTILVKNKFLFEKNLPVIFGNDYLRNNTGSIDCGIDLFASVFFMLTRWEEYVISDKDIHKRFKASNSLSAKEKFIHRPVVNEMVEFLWNMLVYLGIKQERKQKKYMLIPTHDVDMINYPFFFRRMIGDLVKRKKPELMFKRFEYIIRIQRPFDTFDFLMSISEKYNTLSHFYFINGGDYKYDGKYSILNNTFKKIYTKIKNRGHIVGIHSSYFSYNNLKLWKKEKRELEDAVKNKITEGRQHYLRFEIPITWKIANENGLEIDTSLGYHDYEGFRCGTGDEFSVFDITDRKNLNLKERPLIIMDETLRGYRNLKPEDAFTAINVLKKKSKKYNMKFTILFHNSSFDEVDWKGWKDVYKNVF